MRIHRIYCKSVSEEDSNFELDQSQSSHLSKVLRLQVNDELRTPFELLENDFFKVFRKK